MSADKASLVLCPICSAENHRDVARCFLCGQSLVGAEPVAANKPVGLALPIDTRQPTFRVSTLMLLIGLIAVFLGLAREGLGWAVLFAIPTSIALFRTVAISGNRESRFNPVAVFLATFAAVIVVAVAAGAAFCFTCFGIAATGTGPYGGDRAAEGIIIGGIVGLAVLIGLTVVFVRVGRRKRGR